MNTLFESSDKHPNDVMFNTISEIISGRYTIQSTIDKILPLVKNAIVREEIGKWKSSMSSRYGWLTNVMMKEIFHQPPKFAFALAKQTQETIQWLNKKLKLSLSIKADIKSAQDAFYILETRDTLMSAIGATGISKFVKTTKKAHVRKFSFRKHTAKCIKNIETRNKLATRNTCRAQFVFQCETLSANHKILVKRSSKKLYFGDYKRAVKFVSKFVGRVHRWFSAWMRAQAGITAKIGLVDIILKKHCNDLKNYPITMIFLALASSEFSKRKEFTLESQKQGGLNTYLTAILNVIIQEERDALKYIAYMIPAIEIWKHVDETFLRAIRFEWKQWMQLYSIVLEEQWMKGVRKSSRRSMRVLPGEHHQKSTNKKVPKSGVNSILWNAVADSWNSGASFMRGTDIVLKEPVTFWGKTLQLIANDQFRWGLMAGKKVSTDILLFREVTKEFLPWHIVHPSYSHEFDGTHALHVFFASIEKLKITTCESWINIPNLKLVDITSHHNMICGCTVPPMSQELYEYLSASTGIFGATGWNGL